MILWHNTGDASRIPENVRAGDEVVLWIGSHPIEPGQTVWIHMTLRKADGRKLTAIQPAGWQSNNDQRNNSYWTAEIGSFDAGDRLEYKVEGGNTHEKVECVDVFGFDVA
jgi:hypothetical protein